MLTKKQAELAAASEKRGARSDDHARSSSLGARDTMPRRRSLSGQVLGATRVTDDAGAVASGNPRPMLRRKVARARE